MNTTYTVTHTFMDTTWEDVPLTEIPETIDDLHKEWSETNPDGEESDFRQGIVITLTE